MKHNNSHNQVRGLSPQTGCKPLIFKPASNFLYLLFLLVLLTGLTVPVNSIAQNERYPLHRHFNILINKYILNKKLPLHTSLKPFLETELSRYADFDTIVYQRNRMDTMYKTKRFPRIYQKLRYQDLVYVDKNNFQLQANILLNMKASFQPNTSETHTLNTRGIMVKGNLGSKISFYSAFYENQAFFPDYISRYVDKQLVIPGQGAWKEFKGNGYDFSSANGYLSITPLLKKKWLLNIQFGHGKHFIGNGYRSLLLSDNSFNYPFFKLTTRYNAIRYTIIYSEFQDFEHVYYSYHYRKHATYNYLDFLIGKSLEIGLLETSLCKTSGNSYINRFNPNYFIPLPIIRPLQFGLNHKDMNILLGLNAKFLLSRTWQLYAQVVIDNFDLSKAGEGKHYFENKIGYQFGVKFFGSAENNALLYPLYLQVEYNQVAPYVYGNATPQQHYSHYNQPLAHPLGAGFREITGIMKYNLHDFLIEIKCNYATTSTDSLHTHYGANIFLPEELAFRGTQSYNNTIGQGNKTNILNINAQLSYLVNPASNLQLFTGIHYRKATSNVDTNSRYLFLGIRTALANYYYDF